MKQSTSDLTSSLSHVLTPIPCRASVSSTTAHALLTHLYDWPPSFGVVGVTGSW